MKNRLLLVFFIAFLMILIFGWHTPAAQAQTQHQVRYYGVSNASPGDFNLLKQYGINLVQVVVHQSDLSALNTYIQAAETNNMHLIVWPIGPHFCGANCIPWYYSGGQWYVDDAVKPILNRLVEWYSTNTGSQLLVGVNAFQEPNNDGISISQQVSLVNLLKSEYGLPIANWIDNVVDFGVGSHSEWVSIGANTIDWPITWTHCMTYQFSGSHSCSELTCELGNPGNSECCLDQWAASCSQKCYGPEGTCAYGLDKMSRDRAIVGDQANYGVLLQAFEAVGYNNAHVPTAAQMYEEACRVAQSGIVDMMIWYDWDKTYGGYTGDLHSQRLDPDGGDRWEAMKRIYDDCINTTILPTPTPTPTTGPSPTPTPTPPPKDPDLDNNNQVNAQDMRQLLAAWGPINPAADEDLDSNGKVNSLDAGRIIANWTDVPPASPTPTSTPPPGATPTPTPTPGSPPPPGEFLYGARYASANSYWDLAGLGIMHPNSIVYSSGFESQVDNIISTAQAVKNTYPNFKPSLFMWDQSTGDWSVTCGGISSAGNAFIQYLNSQNYWDDIYAINGLHEPLGRYCCSSVDQIRGVVAQIKSLSNGQAMIFEKIFSDVSEYECGLSFADGICDYCAVLYHPYQGSFQSTTLSNNVKRHIDIVKGVPSGTTLNKFTPWLAAIYFPGYLYMPSPTELYDAGNIILSAVSPRGRQVDGLIWYTWDNVNQWTGLNQYNGDGQRDGRMNMIEAVGRLR